jgi:hypothetical protein
VTPNRVRRWGQALVLADELPAGTKHLYVHFLHTPASVTRYAAMIRGLTWSTSAHAKDIYTLPAWEKAEKIAAMEWLVTCTAANVDHLRSLAQALSSCFRLAVRSKRKALTSCSTRWRCCRAASTGD